MKRLIGIKPLILLISLFSVSFISTGCGNEKNKSGELCDNGIDDDGDSFIDCDDADCDGASVCL